MRRTTHDLRRALAVAAVLLSSGCSLGRDEDAGPAPPQLASGRPLPARCVPREPASRAVVTFVARGEAWALRPGAGRVTCLFGARRPGPFTWGPRGDRALLARLEVRGLRGAPHRAPTRVAPDASSWGRPIGKSIVFVGRGGHALLKAHPAGGGFSEITPVRGAEYERVVYHPSGLALAFVLRQHGRASIWLSTNRGQKPRKFVHGRLHTAFDALAFDRGGMTLYFAAEHVDHRVDVHSLALVGATSAPVVWRGGPEEHVTDLIPGRDADLALTTGRSCETRSAIALTARHRRGAVLLPHSGPTRAVGWIDDRHVLVAAGGCGAKLDLYSIDARSLRSQLLVRSVDAAAVRRPETYPPPPLAPQVLGARSSFA